ncbi:MAG: glycerate kinase [Victivallales bacterium]|nr:glycerate kinase [Victivallales bacterium]
MKIAVAPDKFKGSLTSAEAADCIATALREVLPSAIVSEFPLADGGEGTCEALTRARGGKLHTVTVRGPLGEPVKASFGLSGNTAFMEMASAAGLQLLSKDKRNPMKTSTYGFGQMLLEAIRLGAKEITAGIGGSATNDGGTGMAEALGARFYGKDGKELHGLCGEMLEQIARVDCTPLADVFSDVHICIACDVTNPLLGPNGASAVYAPQKGASPNDVLALEAGLAQLYRVADAGNTSPVGLPGDGAAGGLGFGCRLFCKASFQSGGRLVIRESGLEEVIKASAVDLIITGEGCTDSQTEAGKLCAVLAEMSRRNHIPCVLLSGGIAAPRQELMKLFDGVFVSGIGRGSLEDTLKHAREDLRAAATSLAFAIKIGMKK